MLEAIVDNMSSNAHVVNQHVDQPGGGALLQFCMLESELEEMGGPGLVAAD